MGLNPSKHKPCLFSGVIHGRNPHVNPRHTIHVDFVFFSESDVEESRFKRILNDKVTADFMGDVEFFLGSSFKWNQCPDEHLLAHVSQQAFDKHAASRFRLEDYNRVLLMTPYRLVEPIKSIPDPDPLERKSAQQSIWGSNNWLAI